MAAHESLKRFEDWLASPVGQSIAIEHPIKILLLQASVERIGNLETLARGQPDVVSLRTILGELRELWSYVVEYEWRPINPQNLAEWLALIPSPKVVKAATTRRVGRPISQRVRATEALELHNAGKGSWSQIARKMGCSCKPGDDPARHEYCTRRLRQAVRELEHLLARYGIPAR